MSTNAQGARIYNLFPLLAGSVVDWYGHLDRVAAMGFDWLYINPFHYPGFSGSLYAVKDFYALNPLFDNGSGQAAGKQIADFVAYAEEKGISVMMDLVVNHTSKDSLLVDDHPEWFEHQRDGSEALVLVQEPTFAEIPPLGAVVEVVEPGPRHVVDLFEPGAQVLGDENRVRANFPRCPDDRRPHVVRHLVRGIAAESTDPERHEMADHALEVRDNGRAFGALIEVDGREVGPDGLLARVGRIDGTRRNQRAVAPSVSFPESHDTVRLGAEFAADGISDRIAVERGYKQAYLFCAVFSTGLLMPIGYECGFQRKLNVVRTRPADWEKPTFDLVPFITEVNAMKAAEPVFNEEGPQTYQNLGDGLFVCLTRRTNDGSKWALTILNASLSLATTARLEGLEVDPAAGREVTPGKKGRKKPIAAGDVVTLAPGDIRVFVGEA